MADSNYGFTGKAPNFITIQENINIAKQFQATHTEFETADWFYQHVKNNKNFPMSATESMDYKQLNPDWADFGNYNYAVVGKALGFSDDALRVMAGFAQQKSNGNSFIGSANTALFDVANHGDNPEDQIIIQKGIDAANTAGIGNNGMSMLNSFVLNYDSWESATNEQKSLWAELWEHETTSSAPANQPFNNNNKALDPTNDKQPNYPNVDKTQPPQTLLDILGLTDSGNASPSTTDQKQPTYSTAQTTINNDNSTQKETAKDIYSAGTKTFYDTIGAYLDKNGADATSKSTVGKVGGTVGNAWDVIEGVNNVADGNYRDATGNAGSIFGGAAGGVFGTASGVFLGALTGDAETMAVLGIAGGVKGSIEGGHYSEEAFKKAYDDIASAKKSVDDYLTQPPANQPFNNNNKALAPNTSG